MWCILIVTYLTCGNTVSAIFVGQSVLASYARSKITSSISHIYFCDARGCDTSLTAVIRLRQTVFRFLLHLYEPPHLLIFLSGHVFDVHGTYYYANLLAAGLPFMGFLVVGVSAIVFKCKNRGTLELEPGIDIA